MGLRQSISSAGKRLLRAGRLLFEMCCDDFCLECGCCVDQNPPNGAYECELTGLGGQAGRDYCINVLGGIPLEGVVNGQLQCIPCVYVTEEGGTYAPCPLTNDVGACGYQCADDQLPATISVDFNGPFGEGEPSTFFSCPPCDPPSAEASQLIQCALEQQRAGQALMRKAMMGSITAMRGFGGAYDPSTCDFSANFLVEECRPGSCSIENTPYEDPCYEPNRVEVYFEARLTACGYRFTLTVNLLQLQHPLSPNDWCPCGFPEPEDYDYPDTYTLMWGPGWAHPSTCSGQEIDCTGETEGPIFSVSDYLDDALVGAPEVRVDF